MTYTERIKNIYETLYANYGPQGWWPLTGSQEINHDLPLRQRGYHPLDYTLPTITDSKGQWEICMGAILTQNTSWTQVEKALARLQEQQLLHCDFLLPAQTDILKEAIKPAGYFNQKTKKVMAFRTYFSDLKGAVPSRADLLAIWGIGPETADSMLLYAFHVPVFVVDAYTRRIFSRLFYTEPPTNLENYDHLQHLFHTTYTYHNDQEKNDTLIIFKEYHALLVEHGKTRCKKKPACTTCPLATSCDYATVHTSHNSHNSHTSQKQLETQYE